MQFQEVEVGEEFCYRYTRYQKVDIQDKVYKAGNNFTRVVPVNARKVLGDNTSPIFSFFEDIEEVLEVL